MNGRTVILAFDSDVTTKPSVGEALLRLRRFLASKGALVRICVLPDGGDGGRTDAILVVGHAVDELYTLVVDDLPSSNGGAPDSEPKSPAAEPRTLDEVVETFLEVAASSRRITSAVRARHDCREPHARRSDLGSDRRWERLGQNRDDRARGGAQFVHAASSLTGEAAVPSASSRRDREYGVNRRSASTGRRVRHHARPRLLRGAVHAPR